MVPHIHFSVFYTRVVFGLDVPMRLDFVQPNFVLPYLARNLVLLSFFLQNFVNFFYIILFYQSLFNPLRKMDHFLYMYVPYRSASLINELCNLNNYDNSFQQSRSFWPNYIRTQKFCCHFRFDRFDVSFSRKKERESTRLGFWLEVIEILELGERTPCKKMANLHPT
jgi:hypothetical protein